MAVAAAKANQAADPICLDWKMSQVLERHPALVETLAALYPGFARLRNPVLRALRAPRISVAQAARVAGMDPAALCRALNEAAGISGAAEPEEIAAPAAVRDEMGSAGTEAARGVEIDVSDLPPPEPMVKILETLTALPAGGTLHVRHSRVPVYLYPRLEAMGCAHETSEIGPGHVELLIRKPVEPRGGPA